MAISPPHSPRVKPELDRGTLRVMTASRFHDAPELQGRIVVLRRTSVRFETAAQVLAEGIRVAAELDKVGRNGRRLLMDVRDVPPNAEERFRAPLAELREKIRPGFDRVAVLVKTKIGLLQANRILTEDDDTASRIFDDEAAARAFLAVD